MAKTTGLGDNVYVAGYNLSGDIGSLGRIGGGPAALEVTGVDKSGIERIGGLLDGSFEWTAYFNPAENQAHDRFSLLPTADVIVSYFRGTTLGDPAANIVAKQINYDGNRGTDGSFTFSVSAQANGFGTEWGRQLTAGIRTDTEATDGSSVDFGAASSNGLQAYLHVTAFTGTDCTITIEESSDDGDTDAFAAVTNGAFTQVTGITSERIATASDQSVERYLRVATSGTFTSISFAVSVVRLA